MRLPFSPIFCIGAVVIGLVAGTGYFLFKDTTPPELSLVPEAKVVTPGQKLSVVATDKESGIRSITVTVRKNSQTQVLAKNVYSDKAGMQTAEFAFKDTFLRDGAFTLVINAADASFAGFGQGNSTTKEYAMTMDTTPPKVTINTSYPYVRRGGSSCVSYKISRDVEASGIRVNDKYFPGYQQENGDYICFFPFPYYMEDKDYQPYLVVTDFAGNKSETRVPLYRIKHRFKTDTVKINDRFFELKLPEFRAFYPDITDPLTLFNKVNGELRQANAAKLLEVGQKSAPKALWNDAFLPLPNAAVRAGFAEHRTYLYNDVKQDVEATHLGLDLASLARSPVPAGNDGVVVFADYLGIYGNVVVLDHGLGLQSLYSHLSEISVETGQRVTRGQILGRTGATGMAVGDHLHFGILISGLEVSPIEWLDPKWIRDNITDRLKEAGAPAPEMPQAAQTVQTAPAPTEERKPAAKPAPAPQRGRRR
ncbi:Peptidase M23 family protein [uncultured delta proteobacterium]|uniref:Peptidase M23 family protein n=1 Tax=uncultured delta proteobacterium TaxID=34034 RepID=A0A212J3W4_9DELT|nr:Peptidase M23 family protein [uncultured delta proteobacterium]